MTEQGGYSVCHFTASAVTEEQLPQILLREMVPAQTAFHREGLVRSRL